jgi:hypothetical protein
MKMPDKDPGWLAVVAACYYNYATPINDFLVAFIVAFRRAVWRAEKSGQGSAKPLCVASWRYQSARPLPSSLFSWFIQFLG